MEHSLTAGAPVLGANTMRRPDRIRCKGLGTLALTMVVGASTIHSQTTHGGEVDDRDGACGGVRVTVVNQVFRPSSGSLPLTLQAYFDQDITAAERVVILHAMAEWDTILIASGTTPSPYAIGFHHAALPGSTLAQADTDRYSNGILMFSNIDIDNDGSTTWFVDPSPGNDAEFDGGMAPAGHDLLTVVRHEIGHAIGWVGALNPFVESYVSDSVFDPVRLNILVTPPDGDPETSDGNHANPSAHPGDLMIPTFPSGTRRPIRLYPDATLPARAFSYELPVRVIDRNATGSPQTGSVHAPFTSLNLALINAPSNSVFLFIPGDYAEPAGLFPLQSAMTLLAARGSGARVRL